jgi:hypothetical protein
MDDNKYLWAIGQVDQKYPVGSPTNVALHVALNVFERIVSDAEEPGVDVMEVHSELGRLLRGEPLDPVSDPSVWAPASQYHEYSDRARVAPGYDGPGSGWQVNGRTGTIVGKRHGYFVIEFDSDVDGAPRTLHARPAAFEVDIRHLVGERQPQ